ncbi:aromatic ring-opening dioxygenase, catalytic protein [Medicago truncatula]|uniref:Aromatic ring-opening dioxygenase, catalytic protein n=1 Tax=Medicago truncatula TaxID=3880 RepID=G7KHS6_MEDTR|nr:aromatic ring-opening dioxygenase, catalytic protein [Medicago truncatula]
MSLNFFRYWQLKYPAPGAPKLAKRVKEQIEASGLSQLSISSDRNGTYHYNLGKALAPLKDESVLILGSENATHNKTVIAPRESPPFPWAVEFMSWLKNSLIEGKYDEVNHYEEKAPYAKLAHPHRPEHMFPLNVAMGAAGENSKAKVIHDSWDLGSLSYVSFGFTAACT